MSPKPNLIISCNELFLFCPIAEVIYNLLSSHPQAMAYRSWEIFKNLNWKDRWKRRRKARKVCANCHPCKPKNCMWRMNLATLFQRLSKCCLMVTSCKKLLAVFWGFCFFHILRGKKSLFTNKFWFMGFWFEPMGASLTLRYYFVLINFYSFIRN